jgi:hypothetical protein
LANSPRHIVAGTSIDSLVYSDTGIGDPTKLWAAQMPSMVGITIANMSSPGQSICGQNGFGLYNNKNGIGTICGYSGCQGVIIPTGPNDWDGGVSIYDYMDKLRAVIAYCRDQLNIPVLVVTPIWKHDQAVAKPHADGQSWTLAQWRYFTANVAYEEGAKLKRADGSNLPKVYVIDGASFDLCPTDFVADGTHMNESGHCKFAPQLVTKARAVGYPL